MKNFLISIKITLAFCVILFVGYVLVLWAVAAFTQPDSGQAQVVRLDGQVVGALNVGQQFTDSTYIWARPSAVDYNGSGSGASNKSNFNPEHLAQVEERIEAFLAAHPYLERKQVPAEMVTASGSGLDPHISVGSAKLQAQRVASARGIAPEEVEKWIDATQETNLFGPSIVNVLKLNVALDQHTKK